jgi:hypothetical protein
MSIISLQSVHGIASEDFSALFSISGFPILNLSNYCASAYIARNVRHFNNIIQHSFDLKRIRRKLQESAPWERIRSGWRQNIQFALQTTPQNPAASGYNPRRLVALSRRKKQPNFMQSINNTSHINLTCHTHKRKSTHRGEIKQRGERKGSERAGRTIRPGQTAN